MQNKEINRILFITYSLNFGGAERVISELANQFIVLGKDVTILLFNLDEIAYFLDPRIRVIPLSQVDFGKNKPIPFFQRITLLRKHIKSQNPETVISFLSMINIHVILATLFTKRIVILSERNDPRSEPSSKVKRIVRDICYKFADGVVFQTDEAMRYFSKTIMENSIVIPNPLKRNLPDPVFDRSSKKIVAIGRLVKQKNYPLLIHAFSKIEEDYPDYSLDIYGDGTLKKKLDELVKGLNLERKIIFKGTTDNLHNEILGSSIYALTSNYEGMPNSLMEAMALGITCISTDCPSGGPASLIKNKYNGILVKVGQVDDLATNFRKILNDPQYSSYLAKNAVKIRESHHISVISEKWIDFINIRASKKKK